MDDVKMDAWDFQLGEAIWVVNTSQAKWLVSLTASLLCQNLTAVRKNLA